MNNKMAINIYLSTIESKKLSTLEEQRQNHGYSDRFDCCQLGGGCGGVGREVRGLGSTNR